ncbi:hypothetical protein SCHPADRAFT_1002149 [Schizopora paradoxa]|uniref:FAS1 domain-containing protein n=1 Tax=Schizopora paradoxa TaxID=27342 RepID=A0A0H2RB89_9AGAM|nr:hypothetical protein SCHPADRAFT_1002149 [Schizopora paradoxa]
MLARLAALVALSGVLATSFARDWELFDEHQRQHGMHVPVQEHGHFDYFEPQPHHEWHHPELAHFEESAPEEEHRRPFPHPKKPVELAKTIYEFLETDPNFSRLFKVVNFSSEVTSLLNDSSKSVTFFALPNSAFPKRPPKGKKPEARSTGIMDLYNPLGWQMQQLETAEILVDEMDDILQRAAELIPGHDVREQFEKAITAILLYHTLPEELSPVQLALNSTFATSLKSVHGALGDEAQRIRVGKSLTPIGLSINLYSKVTRGLFTLTNGAVYTISKPLVPLPPAFDSVFLFQSHFSILTSALQHAGVDGLLKFSFRHPENTTAVTTVFAPTNAAFERLPPRLRLFLFSPFGKVVLKKLLQYHIVPNITVHTDWILNKTVEASSIEYGILEDNDEYAEFFEEDDGDFDFEAGTYDNEQEDDSSEMFGAQWMEHRRGPPPHSRGPRDPPPAGPRPPGRRAHKSSRGPFPNLHRVGCFGGPHRGPGAPWPEMHQPHFQPSHRFAGPPRGFCPPPPHPEWHAPPPPGSFPHPPPPHHEHAAPPPFGSHPPFSPPTGFCPPPSPHHWQGPPSPFGPHPPPPPGLCPPPPHADWHAAPHFSGPPPPPSSGFCPPPSRHAGPPPPPPPSGRHAPPSWRPHPRPKFPHPRLTQNITLELPTAATNHSLSVQLLKTEFKLPHLPPRFDSVVIVNGVPAKVADVTALNGAIHVVDRLIVPKRPGHPKGSPPGRGDGPGKPHPPGMEFVDEEWNDHVGDESEIEGEGDEWADWEEWLVEWAISIEHPEELFKEE